MEEKLFKKLEQEMDNYKDYIKERGVEFAIDRAYELTSKQEIIDALRYDNSLSKVQIKALLSSDNVLDELYDDWLSFDVNMREHINYSLDKSLNTITENYLKNKNKSKDYQR